MVMIKRVQTENFSFPIWYLRKYILNRDNIFFYEWKVYF